MEIGARACCQTDHIPQDGISGLAELNRALRLLFWAQCDPIRQLKIKNVVKVSLRWLGRAFSGWGAAAVSGEVMRAVLAAENLIARLPSSNAYTMNTWRRRGGLAPPERWRNGALSPAAGGGGGGSRRSMAAPRTAAPMLRTLRYASDPGSNVDRRQAAFLTLPPQGQPPPLQGPHCFEPF